MNATGPLSPNGLRDTRRRTFAALAVPNYRRYFFGQATSLVGTWMQMAAQSWLVLSLTGSAAALGLIVALQTLPVLLLGSLRRRDRRSRRQAPPDGRAADARWGSRRLRSAC